MHEGELPLGIGPDGKPWPVHATASPDYGAGALLGLVAGATLAADGQSWGPAPRELEVLAELVASLMQRGLLDADDLRRRYAAGSPPDGASAVLRAVPIALFHAGEAEQVLAAVRAEAAIVGAGPLDALAAATVGGAISAGTFDLVEAYDMAVAGVTALDAAAAALPDGAEAHAQLRDVLREAVASETRPTDAGALPASARAVRAAFWHLLHTDDLPAAVRAVAAQGDPVAAALTGALVGAAHGRDAVPHGWQVALAAPAAPLLTLLAPDEP